MDPPPTLPPLLRLPIELRREIYSYLLPRTFSLAPSFQRPLTTPASPEYNLTYIRSSPAPNDRGTWKMVRTLPPASLTAGQDIVWRRGCTNLLAVCQQLHEECANELYGGSNVFVLDVSFDRIVFHQRWRTPAGLTPSRDYTLLEHFSYRNLLRIRNYVVNVSHVDDYTGMIKFNCQGRGLQAGIKGRVRELVDVMRLANGLGRVHVHLIGGKEKRERFASGRVHRVVDEGFWVDSQEVLKPFEVLRGVRMAKVTGVSAGFAGELEESMGREREVG